MYVGEAHCGGAMSSGVRLLDKAFSLLVRSMSEAARRVRGRNRRRAWRGGVIVRGCLGGERGFGSWGRGVDVRWFGFG